MSFEKPREPVGIVPIDIERTGGIGMLRNGVLMALVFSPCLVFLAWHLIEQARISRMRDKRQTVTFLDRRGLNTSRLAFVISLIVPIVFFGILLLS